jgi:hypothetical protein
LRLVAVWLVKRRVEPVPANCMQQVHVAGWVGQQQATAAAAAVDDRAVVNCVSM